MAEKSKNGVKNGVRPQNKHLKPYKKGENGGAHRPKGVLNYATMRERAIRKLAEMNGKTPLEIDDEINANALLEARKGNFQFYKDDKDRTYGQAASRTELTGKNGEPLFDVEARNKTKQAVDSYLTGNTGL